MSVDPFEWSEDAVVAKEVVERFALDLSAVQQRLKGLRYLDLTLDSKGLEKGFDLAIARINAFAEREFEILKRSTLNEEDYKKAVKQLREETLKTKRRVAEEAYQALKSEIDREIQEEERYRQKALEARQEKLKIQRDLEETLREMRRGI